MSSIKTILADAHLLFVEGFQKIIEEMDSPDMTVVAKAGSASSLKEELYRSEADLLFMELNFYDEDGLSLIPTIKDHVWKYLFGYWT